MKGKAAAAHDDDGVLDPAALHALRNPSPYTNWELRANVLAGVTYKGPLRWAHEIVALDAAGLYSCDAGLQAARDVLKVAA